MVTVGVSAILRPRPAGDSIRPAQNLSGGAALKRLRVRTGRGYEIPFNVMLGQENAEFVSRTDTPLGVFGQTADAICLLEPGYDLLHFVNAIPLFPRSPFLVTFEDHLPRMWPTTRPGRSLERLLLRQLSSGRCGRILAMSNYAARQFRHTNSDHPDLPALEEKLEVLYPSIEPRRKAPKKPNPTLKVLSVGADFMRKGMPALLRAHTELRRRRVPIETTIVSSLNWSPNDYVGPPDESVVEKEKERLNQDGVSFLGKVPNQAALDLMEQHDYLVLPTLHDTFGYVLIEAMASGTPVIASDTCATPEIVEHRTSGFLLPMDNDAEVGMWTWIDRPKDQEYVDAYLAQVGAFAISLADQLEQAWQGRAGYEAMSSAALERIKERFNRERARQRLETLYAEAGRR